METLFQEYEPVKNMLKIGEFLSKRVNIKKEKEPKKRGITNERQVITKEIAEIIKKENGKVNERLLAIKLSHLPINVLYFMKSEGLDYRNRTGQPFAKYIYGSIKSHE